MRCGGGGRAQSGRAETGAGGDEEKDGVGDEAEVAANPLMEEWRLVGDKRKMPRGSQTRITKQLLPPCVRLGGGEQRFLNGTFS